MADNGLLTRTEASHVNADFAVLLYIEVEREKNRDDLTDYSGNCSSGNFQSGQTEQSEDQNRIQNNINDRAESLSDHVVNGACLWTAAVSQM